MIWCNPSKLKTQDSTTTKYVSETLLDGAVEDLLSEWQVPSARLSVDLILFSHVFP